MSIIFNSSAKDSLGMWTRRRKRVCVRERDWDWATEKDGKREREISETDNLRYRKKQIKEE